MQALVFDLDGTLLRYTTPYEALLECTFEAVSQGSEPEWLDTYNEQFFSAFQAFETDPVRRAFRATAAPGDGREFADRLHRAEIEATELPPYTHEDLAALGERHSLAVLTNGMSDWQRGKLDAHDLTGYFDAVVTSYEVAAHKPDREPFETVERRLGLDSYAMIGDSDDDAEGARGAGWQFHRYTGDRLLDAVDSLDGS